MYHNDPILKQDGTLITLLDVAVLCFAKFVAGHFLEVDDEDYSPAYRRMYTFGGVFFIGFAIITVILGHRGTLLPLSLIGVGLLAMGRIKAVKCDGTGTVKETQSDKLGALCTLIIAPTFVSLYTLLLKPPDISMQSLLVFMGMLDFGLSYLALQIGYVRRLGEPPKKRARAYRPAFLPR